MSEFQLSLTLDAPRARRTDPKTSHTAARRARVFAPSHAAKILAALKTHGDMSAAELCPLVGLTVVQIDRRAAEMRRDGLIVQTEQTRLGCHVLKAVG